MRFHVISANQWSEQLLLTSSRVFKPNRVNCSSESEAISISLMLLLTHNLASDALFVLRVAHSSTTSESDRDEFGFFNISPGF